jgi:hydrogenase nickel incorporation protein HypA/HybF
MHELSIALSILEVAEEEAGRHGGAKVEAIYVKLGPLAGVVKEALLSAYELASGRTQFEQTRLVVEEVPIMMRCSKCQAERPVHSLQRLCCIECDEPASEIVHGRELLVSALELAE